MIIAAIAFGTSAQALQQKTPLWHGVLLPDSSLQNRQSLPALWSASIDWKAKLEIYRSPQQQRSLSRPHRRESYASEVSIYINVQELAETELEDLQQALDAGRRAQSNAREEHARERARSDAGATLDHCMQTLAHATDHHAITRLQGKIN